MSDEAVASSLGLQNRNALVTGAGSGIGRAIARALARAGMRLWLVGRHAEALRATVPEEAEVRIVTADLASPAGIEAAAASCPSSLDVLVHSAGLFVPGGATEVNAMAWQRMDALNLHAPLQLTRLCGPALRAATGQVVMMNSTAGLRSPAPGNAAYAAGKHALRAATDALRQELNPHGIRVLSIYPGRTHTPMQDAILQLEGRTAPADRLLQPDDVASIVLAALTLPSRAEVTDITIRPSRAL